jgi:hypothetical protein
MKTRICTCQKFCQAPPEGKVIPLRTWYNHAAQCALEEGMDLSVREAQKRRHPTQRASNKVSASALKSCMCFNFSIFLAVKPLKPTWTQPQTIFFSGVGEYGL